jgi:hypothetical protein
VPVTDEKGFLTTISDVTFGHEKFVMKLFYSTLLSNKLECFSKTIFKIKLPGWLPLHANISPSCKRLSTRNTLAF